MKFNINQPMNFYKDIRNNVYQILTKDKFYNVTREEWNYVLMNLSHWRGLDEPNTLRRDR